VKKIQDEIKYIKEICLYVAGIIVVRQFNHTFIGIPFLSRCE